MLFGAPDPEANWLEKVYAELLVVVWHFQTELHEVIEETVSLLVRSGASVNAMSTG